MTSLSSFRLVLLVSSLLASSTAAFQVSPTQASPSPTTASSSLGYSVSADVPESAYEKNMRQYVQQKQQAQQSQQQSQHRLPNMMTVSTPEEFQEQVTESPQLTVVRFHAPFCKACQAMAPLLERFAKSHPDMKFVQVAYDKRNAEIKALTKQLGIKKVPFGLVYHPTVGLVETANFNKRYFNGVAQMLESYQEGSCQLPEEVDEYSNVFEAPYAIVQ